MSARTFAAIRDCDAGASFAREFAGERVPTLDEALALAAELELGANIEIKAERGRDYATAAAVAATVRRLGEQCAAGAGVELPAARGRSNPHAGAAPAAGYPVSPRAARLGGNGASPRLLPCTPAPTIAGVGGARVAAIRAAGYPLMAYTVNDPARARLLYAWGVTSVFSDVPDNILRINPGQSPALARQGAIG